MKPRYSATRSYRRRARRLSVWVSQYSRWAPPSWGALAAVGFRHVQILQVADPWGPGAAMEQVVGDAHQLPLHARAQAMQAVAGQQALPGPVGLGLAGRSL